MSKGPIRPNIEKIKPYLPGKPIEDVERELKIKGVIKLASNENPLGPSPKALASIIKYSNGISLYPDQKCHELSVLLAKRLAVSTDNIVIGNGSDEIMMLLALAYISAGDEVIISHNTFSTYETVSSLMEASIKKVALKDYTYDLKAMSKASGKRTKLIWICNPNSPTGTMNSQREMDALMSEAPEGAIVVIDEAYGEYVESSDYPDSLKYVRENRNVILLRTFSKIYGLAGLRVGYGIAKPDIVKYLKLVRLPFSVNRLGQIAAASGLSDSGHVEMSRKNNSDGKLFLYAELGKLGVSYLKTEANFICMNLDKNADIVFIELMRRGVIVRPLTSFGMPRSIRVTIGTPEQNLRFIKAFSEVLRS